MSNVSDVVVCLLRVRHIASQRARNNLILTHYVGGACSDRALLTAPQGAPWGIKDAEWRAESKHSLTVTDSSFARNHRLSAAFQFSSPAIFNLRRKKKMHQSTSHPESRRLVIIGVLGLLMLHCAAAKTPSAGQQCEGPNMVTRVCGDGLACVPESPGSRVSVCRGNVRVASRVRCCIFHCDFACANCIYMHDHSNQPLMLAPTIKWRSTYLTPICYLYLISPSITLPSSPFCAKLRLRPLAM